MASESPPSWAAGIGIGVGIGLGTFLGLGIPAILVVFIWTYRTRDQRHDGDGGMPGDERPSFFRRLFPFRSEQGYQLADPERQPLLSFGHATSRAWRPRDSQRAMPDGGGTEPALTVTRPGEGGPRPVSRFVVQLCGGFFSVYKAENAHGGGSKG